MNYVNIIYKLTIPSFLTRKVQRTLTIIVDCHSLSNISEILLTVKETIVTKLDLFSAYLMILLVEEFCKYKAFIIPEGLFQSKFMICLVFGDTAYFQDNILVYDKVKSQ